MSDISTIIAIAEAVKDALNESALDPAFKAERRYVPEFSLEELATLRVTVVPKSRDVEQVTRGKIGNDVLIDVAVQKKVDREKPEQCDELLLLAEQIGDFFRTHAIESGQWIKTEHMPIYSPQHLHEKSVFSTVVTLTFKAYT